MAGQIDAKKRRLDQVSASRADTIQQKLQHSAAPTFKVPSLLVTNHTFRVPLDHTGEVEGDIELFVRELVSSDKTGAALPYLLFLQGGPGFECARPTDASTWVKTALTSFRVLLLDQRGTGRSQAITTANLQKRGGPAEQARYLAFFRADSIVRDCEAVRKCMVPADSTGSQWSILGQSFGGFCALTYLSLAPQGLKEVMMAGGIPPGITEPCAADTVYQALFPRVIAQNKKYYGRYPGDVAHVQRIVRCLAAQPGGGARLPSGSLLSPRGLQLLGLSGLGMTGGFDRLHYLLEDFFDSDGDINPSFLKAFESWMPYDTNPLYALVHESIYCQGAASNWRAQAVRDAHFSAQFDAIQCAADDQPVFFTGEVVFPWMFDDFVALRPFKAAADLLAAKADWPSLYDVNVLEANTVPVATATYFEVIEVWRFDGISTHVLDTAISAALQDSCAEMAALARDLFAVYRTRALGSSEALLRRLAPRWQAQLLLAPTTHSADGDPPSPLPSSHLPPPSPLPPLGGQSLGDAPPHVPLAQAALGPGPGLPSPTPVGAPAAPPARLLLLPCPPALQAHLEVVCHVDELLQSVNSTTLTHHESLLVDVLAAAGVHAAVLQGHVCALLVEVAVLRPQHCGMLSDLCVGLSRRLPPPAPPPTTPATSAPGVAPPPSPAAFLECLLDTCREQFLTSLLAAPILGGPGAPEAPAHHAVARTQGVAQLVALLHARGGGVHHLFFVQLLERLLHRGAPGQGLTLPQRIEVLCSALGSGAGRLGRCPDPEVRGRVDALSVALDTLARQRSLPPATQARLGEALVSLSEAMAQRGDVHQAPPAPAACPVPSFLRAPPGSQPRMAPAPRPGEKRPRSLAEEEPASSGPPKVPRKAPAPGKRGNRKHKPAVNLDLTSPYIMSLSKHKPLTDLWDEGEQRFVHRCPDAEYKRGGRGCPGGCGRKLTDAQADWRVEGDTWWCNVDSMRQQRAALAKAVRPR